jgi:galactitol-specific phosphotransferase system IIB component
VHHSECQPGGSTLLKVLTQRGWSVQSTSFSIVQNHMKQADLWLSSQKIPCTAVTNFKSDVTILTHCLSRGVVQPSTDRHIAIVRLEASSDTGCCV